MRRGALPLLAIAAATCLAGVGAANAQAIVVKATGPSAASYPTGRKLPEGTRVVLRDGDVVTVLDRAGSRIFKGAGSFAVDNKVLRDRGLVGMLSRSLSSPVTIRAGAVRGAVPGPASGAMTPRSVWIADIDRGGKVCVPQGSSVYLWRDTNSANRLVWLGEAEGGAMVPLRFPALTSGVAWPSTSLPLVDGRSFRANDEGNPDKGTDFEVVSLAPDALPDSAAELGALLLDKGCTVQFEALASTLAKLDTPDTETR